MHNQQRGETKLYETVYNIVKSISYEDKTVVQ
jgi:hypothetical protein